MEKEIPIIRCCHCGQEYLPSEIFIPTDFFGKPGEIIKNDAGQIEFYLGTDMNLTEEYVCDNCGTPLRITAGLSFNVEASTEEEFEEEYVSTFNKPKKLKLEETDLFND